MNQPATHSCACTRASINKIYTNFIKYFFLVLQLLKFSNASTDFNRGIDTNMW